MFRKIKKFFTKWRLVNTCKFTIEPFPYPTTKFVLTEKQQKQVDELYEKKGGMDYIFYYTGIGEGFKVKIWETDEYIDLTDYDAW